MLIYSTICVNSQITKDDVAKSHILIINDWYHLQTLTLGRIYYYSLHLKTIHVMNMFQPLLASVESCAYCFSILEHIQLPH